MATEYTGGHYIYQGLASMGKSITDAIEKRDEERKRRSQLATSLRKTLSLIQPESKDDFNVMGAEELQGAMQAFILNQKQQELNANIAAINARQKADEAQLATAIEHGALYKAQKEKLIQEEAVRERFGNAIRPFLERRQSNVLQGDMFQVPTLPGSVTAGMLQGKLKDMAAPMVPAPSWWSQATPQQRTDAVSQAWLAAGGEPEKLLEIMAKQKEAFDEANVHFGVSPKGGEYAITDKGYFGWAPNPPQERQLTASAMEAQTQGIDTLETFLKDITETIQAMKDGRVWASKDWVRKVLGPEMKGLAQVPAVRLADKLITQYRTWQANADILRRAGVQVPPLPPETWDYIRRVAAEINQPLYPPAGTEAVMPSTLAPTRPPGTPINQTGPALPLLRFDSKTGKLTPQ